MAAADRIYELASAVLAAIVDHWPAAGDAEPLPDVQYVAFGQVAWDCEQVTVSVDNTFPAQGDVTFEAGTNAASLLGMRGIGLSCSIIRCVPTVDIDGETPILPDPTDIEASARIALIDADTIRKLLVAAQGRGEFGGCSGMAFDRWSAQGPDGGLGGGELAVRLAMF